VGRRPISIMERSVTTNRKTRAKILSSAAAVALVFSAGTGVWHYDLLSSAPAHAAEFAQPTSGFADLAAKVKPAVISVRVKMDDVEQTSQLGEDLSPFQRGLPSEKFFQQFGFSGGQEGHPKLPRTITGVGSGFFISADGYAVTNNHVVDHAKSVQVTTDDGSMYEAKVIGTDPTTDLALIKVEGRSNFPFVKFAAQPARIGDWVLAVGNPFGLGGTVTAGIVSANGRDIGAGPYDYLQIDAPMNKGNSGGPAFDMNGDVIGVNTAIFSPSGGSVGIGFDVPATTAKVVIAQLKDTGHVTRGYMGVRIQTITPEMADSLGLKEARGAIVDEPEPGSPAAKAGIKAGDVIVSLNGADVKDSRDVARTVGMLPPGTSVRFGILQNGKPRDVTLTLASTPSQQAEKTGEQQTNPKVGLPHLGLSLAPADQVAGAGQEGLVVTAVEPDGPAADHGIEPGDVILQVGGKAVSNVSEVRQALSDAKAQGKHDVLLRLKTADATEFVAIPLGKG
jgi:serine protease Do